MNPPCRINPAEIELSKGNTMEPWIQTGLGLKFDFAEPVPDMIDIRDIAAALARQPRFAGHTNKFYSVAQHSVFVSSLVKRAGGTHLQQSIALLHDATEAYTGDMTAPLKSILPEFKKVESRIWRAICAALFDSELALTMELPAIVKHADAVALATEARDLFDFEPIENWVERLPLADGLKITPLDEADSWLEFTARYKTLFGSVVGAIGNG